LTPELGHIYHPLTRLFEQEVIVDAATREARISAAFVAVVGTLTSNYDAEDQLHALVRDCLDILSMEAGGLALVNSKGELRLVACSSEGVEYVELVQVAADAGPGIESLASGTAVTVADIEAVSEAWPDFARVALAVGFRSALVTPMRLDGRVIGTMTLFCKEPGAVNDRDAALAQALADVATIVILQERVARDSKLVEEQLSRALESRIIIEQAKGIIAGARGMDPDDAFGLLRAYARHGNLTVRAVATMVSEGELGPDDLADNTPVGARPRA
jgi:GAF domain-containing protein